MAGSITVSSITLDSDNNFSIKSNTGATLFFANTTGIDIANSIGATAITNDKILSVANTKISGNIISSQITSVANTQITGNIISSQITSVANTQISGNIASSQITSNPTLYGNVSVTGTLAVSGGVTLTTTLPVLQGGTGVTTSTGTGNVVLSASPTFTGNVTTPLSYVRLNTANGYGSTNTKIRRFTNIVNNVGTDITYADSATLGGTFTINTAGVYSVSYCDQTTGVSELGLSIDSTQLTTQINAITVTNVLAMTNNPGANRTGSVSATFYAAATSIVRAHTNGDATGAGTAQCTQFTIARVQ